MWKKGQLEGISVSVKDMQEIFPEVFRAELGKLKDVKLTIPIPPDATPRFFKPRSVPYALRTRVESEIDKFSFIGWIIEKYENQIRVTMKDYAERMERITEIMKGEDGHELLMLLELRQ